MRWDASEAFFRYMLSATHVSYFSPFTGLAAPLVGASARGPRRDEAESSSDRRLRGDGDGEGGLGELGGGDGGLGGGGTGGNGGNRGGSGGIDGMVI